MNNLLKIKMRFAREPNGSGGGARNLSCNRTVNLQKIQHLIDSLNMAKSYYRSNGVLIKGYLLDIHYDDVIPKSSRIRELLKGRLTPDKSIVGARFSDDPYGEEKHIITHYVDAYSIDATISKLKLACKIIDKFYGGTATALNFNITKKRDNTIKYGESMISDTAIRDIIVDCSVIESFAVPNCPLIDVSDNVLVSLYKTELSVSDVFEKIFGDSSYRYASYGDNSFTIDANTYKTLQKEVPYLISMVATDVSLLKPFERDIIIDERIASIPEPKNEPVVGVIDTLFNQSVYFSKWVDYHEELAFYEKGNINEEDYDHGTEVSSIIVDGPSLNPDLNDGCGRFRVRHFGVCGYRISPSLLIRKIIRIVDQNPDIHVWNLSLGTSEEIARNFMSYESSILDEIQATKNVIFVVSGTNNSLDEDKHVRIGSPADSLNSIVVNSVRRDNKPCSYTRSGPVLSFFNKPDISYYGGDINEKITVCSPSGIVKEMGTSFAAPWISRKLCFLIDKMGFPREVAKALIIDAAAGWEYKQFGYKNQQLIGYGVVPIKIEDVLHCENSEIRFVLYESSTSYKTANYAIPVPKDSGGKYPFIARATLCYFPQCTREQGVDYTDRELSLSFGRIKSDGTIDDINDNIQDNPSAGFAKERKSRREYRKWDNTKFISSLKKQNQAIKSYEDKNWGFCITSKERTPIPKKDTLNFGAVITLKEIKNLNRIEEFKHACLLRGYIVSEVEIDNQVNIYETAQQEIKLN